MRQTPVSSIPEPRPAIPLASWARVPQRPVMRELLTLLGRPGLLSFAHVMPAAGSFPAPLYADVVTELLRGEPGAMQYSVPCSRLKTQIVELMRLRGVQCSEEQVFVTAGAQHALSLIARILLEPGGSLVVDDALYDGMLVVARPFHPVVHTVPVCPPHGMDVDAVGALLAGGADPSLIYLIPDGHNPTASSLPVERRHELVGLARRYGVPIVEDDPYGLLGFGDGYPAPLHALAPERVLYVGSFSKILAPALRLGWIVAPAELIPALSMARQASDMDVISLSQRSVAILLERMDVAEHVATLRREYQRRCEAMLAALAEHFPAEARWHRPDGGMFVWVELPERVKTRELLRDAVEQAGVAFIPGDAFEVAGGRDLSHALRLTFSTLPPDRIEEGIARLGRVVREACR